MGLNQVTEQPRSVNAGGSNCLSLILCKISQVFLFSLYASIRIFTHVPFDSFSLQLW